MKNRFNFSGHKKTYRKYGGLCRDCQLLQLVTQSWTARPYPRCIACGGILDKQGLWREPKTQNENKVIEQLIKALPKIPRIKQSLVPSQELQERETALRLYCGSLGYGFRASAIGKRNGDARHWMIDDVRDNRLVNYWPSTRRYWLPQTDESGKFADDDSLKAKILALRTRSCSTSLVT